MDGKRRRGNSSEAARKSGPPFPSVMAPALTTAASFAEAQEEEVAEVRRDVAVSAPGKVLLCGGYLIVQQHPRDEPPSQPRSGTPDAGDPPPLPLSESRHAGIVLAVNRRFYCRGHLRVTTFPSRGSCAGDNHASANDAVPEDARGERPAVGAFVIRVESPQYGESYEYRWHGSRPRLLVASPNPQSPHRNSFVEHTLRICCDNYSSILTDLLLLRPPLERRGSSATTGGPAETPAGIGEILLVVQGDDEFWSHPSPPPPPSDPEKEVHIAQLPSSRDPTSSQGPPPSASSGSRRPPFRKAPRDADGSIMKTGLGSSACLVTSLAAAMDYLLHPGDNDVDDKTGEIIFPSPGKESDGDSDDADDSTPSHRRRSHQRRLRRIGNLSQLCHCVAQGKVGSGFDVSAACWGSHIYQRFDDATFRLDEFGFDDNALSSRSAPDRSSELSIVQRVVQDETWTGRCVVAPMVPPRGDRRFVVDVLLADTAGGGSSSPGMSRMVLKHVGSDEWNELANINRTLVEIWSRVVRLDLSDRERQSLARYTAKEWIDLGPMTRTNDDANEISEAVVRAAQLLGELAVEFKKWRVAFKALGARAGVDLEPDAQSSLADATERLPGVVSAVVPGAGGHDALACLYVNDEATRHRVIEHWRSSPSRPIPALDVRIVSFGEGVQVEELDSLLSDEDV